MQSLAGRSRWGRGTSLAPDALANRPPSCFPCCCPPSFLHAGLVSSPTTHTWAEITLCFLFKLSWVIQWCVTNYPAEVLGLGWPAYPRTRQGAELGSLSSFSALNKPQQTSLAPWHPPPLTLVPFGIAASAPVPCQERNTEDLKETSRDAPVTRNKQSFSLETDGWRCQTSLTHKVFKVVLAKVFFLNPQEFLSS